MTAFTSASLSLKPKSPMTAVLVTMTLLLVVAPLPPSGAFVTGFSISSAPTRNSYPTFVCRPTTSRLYLVPEQGKQLVAAFNAASVKVKHNNNDNKDTVVSTATTAAVVVDAPSNHEPVVSPAAQAQDEEERRRLPALLTSSAKALVSRVGAIRSMLPHPPAAVSALMDFLPRDLHLMPIKPKPKAKAKPTIITTTTTTAKRTASQDGDDDEDDVVLFPIVGFQFVTTPDDGVRVLPTVTNPSCLLTYRQMLPQQELYGWYCTACQLDSIYSDTYCDDPITKIEVLQQQQQQQQQQKDDNNNQ